MAQPLLIQFLWLDAPNKDDVFAHFLFEKPKVLFEVLTQHHLEVSRRCWLKIFHYTRCISPKTFIEFTHSWLPRYCTIGGLSVTQCRSLPDRV